MPFYDAALSRILPNGEDMYIGLLVAAPPLVEGTDETEASYTGYARQLNTAWTLSLDGDGWLVSNTGAILFPAVTAAPITVHWWGMYTTLVGGNLFAAGPVMNSSYVEVPQLLLVGDQARFNAGTLRIRTGS